MGRGRRGRRSAYGWGRLPKGAWAAPEESSVTHEAYLSSPVGGHLRRDAYSLAGLPPHPDGAARPPDPHVRAARQVRRRPARQRAAGPRGRGRPRLVRPARPDRRDRALRPGPRHQVRDLRDGADQGAIIDELRALDWVPRSVRARPATSSGRSASWSASSAARRPTRRSPRSSASPRRARGQPPEIARSSIAALDELWTVSEPGGDQVALIDTIEDTQGRTRRARSRRPS